MLTLGDKLRAQDVQRWQIVKTLRQQSLAEHSWNVAMIANEIVSMLSYRSDTFRTKVNRWSLIHDLPEVLTGDIATPVKKVIKQNYPEIFENIEDNMDCEYSSYVHVENEVKLVVKLADILESWHFLYLNAASDHGKIIADKLKIRAKKFVADNEYLNGLDINTLIASITSATTELTDV